MTKNAGRNRTRAPSDGPSDRIPEGRADFRATQLPVDLALRAREVAAPTIEDLAEAEAGLTLVRRNYVPPTTLR